MDERRAIARLKRGDIGGLETLVRKYQVQAVRTAYLIARDSALAEDIVQSAFIRVWERIEQFDDTRPFGPWFLRIVANDATKSVTRSRRFIRFDPAGVDDGDGFGGSAAWLADGVAGPEELLERAESREELWQALGKLSPAQREAMVLRYFLELSEAEVAGRQQVATGTVNGGCMPRANGWEGCSPACAPTDRPMTKLYRLRPLRPLRPCGRKRRVRPDELVYRSAAHEDWPTTRRASVAQRSDGYRSLAGDPAARVSTPGGAWPGPAATTAVGVGGVAAGSRSGGSGHLAVVLTLVFRSGPAHAEAARVGSTTPVATATDPTPTRTPATPEPTTNNTPSRADRDPRAGRPTPVTQLAPPEKLAVAAVIPVGNLPINLAVGAGAVWGA